MFEDYHEKLVAYKKSTGWLQFYIAFFLPVVLLLDLYNFIKTYFISKTAGAGLMLIIDFVTLSLIFITVAFARFLDKSSFYTSIIYNFFQLIKLIVSIVIGAISLFSDKDISTSSVLFPSTSSFAITITLIVYIVLICFYIGNIVYYISNKNLFFKSLKQLQMYS